MFDWVKKVFGASEEQKQEQKPEVVVPQPVDMSEPVRKQLMEVYCGN